VREAAKEGHAFTDKLCAICAKFRTTFGMKERLLNFGGILLTFESNAGAPESSDLQFLVAHKPRK